MYYSELLVNYLITAYAFAKHILLTLFHFLRFTYYIELQFAFGLHVGRAFVNFDDWRLVLVLFHFNGNRVGDLLQGHVRLATD